MIPDEPVPLVTTWQPRIRAFFGRRCREQEDVDDLVQEATVSILRCYHAFSHRSTVSTWIYGVCRNVFSNYLYYRDRDQRLLRRLRTDPPDADPCLPVVLQEALGQLPRESKRLYLLYYVDGLTVRDIAARLQRPEGTVKYLLYELRRHVKRLLD